MLKVLHVINSLNVGGAETLLVNSLTKDGLPQHAENILVYFQGSSILEQKLDPAVKVICLDYKGLTDLPRVLLLLRKIVKQHQIDVVHTHLNPAGVYARMALPRNIKQVHTLHTVYSGNNLTRGSLLKLEKNILFKHPNTSLIFLSEFLKADFVKHINFTGKCFVLNNFIEDAFFRPIEKTKNDTFKIIAVGNLKPVKNYTYLFEIFKHLKDVPVSLDIYGEGETEKYQSVIDTEKLNINLMGLNPKVYQVLPGYDLFIMASKFEGYPISVLEAMASGVPCMLSDIAPLNDIAGENAIYFKLDNAEAAACLIKDIVNNKIDSNSLAIAGKMYSQRAQRKIYIEKLLSIYDDIISA